jgi:hypothetical protein
MGRLADLAVSGRREAGPVVVGAGSAAADPIGANPSGVPARAAPEGVVSTAECLREPLPPDPRAR